VRLPVLRQVTIRPAAEPRRRPAERRLAGHRWSLRQHNVRRSGLRRV